MAVLWFHFSVIITPLLLSVISWKYHKVYNKFCLPPVQRDFIMQTGDPTGTGRGGESVYSKLYGDQARFFDAEKAPRIKHRKRGTVSMVNNGNDQHGSQFLITTGENLDYLDGVHTVFGEVTEGMDILTKINEAFVDKDFVPFQDIRINHTVILDDPFDDPPDLPVPDRSPEPTKEQLDSGRIGADEVIDDTEGKGAEELEERLKEKEAKTQAILLEMVGDLPDADVKPPDNVLFVCKLNPVTTDEDLEIIFSRFGQIKSCEIIRDWKSGDSLCYAFIEFEKQEDCEKAYFKMDNVLIDDRRIHVDFSQSVAKIKWKGKGGKYTKDDFKAYEKDVENRSKLALKDQMKPKQEYPCGVNKPGLNFPVFRLCHNTSSYSMQPYTPVTVYFFGGLIWQTSSALTFSPSWKISITFPKSSKYDLLIDEEEEATSHRHSEKKHKEKKHHHHSDDENSRKSKKHKVPSICSIC
uniref:Peptidyl-prolyl cis-trans isomerase n=1 Tax=Acanthochromis polyacanthus TaxID=80966 RepID=A0A3Q1EIF8_9TELE